MNAVVQPLLAHHYRLEKCLGLGQSTVAYRGCQVSMGQPCLALLVRLPHHFTAQVRSRFLQRFHRVAEDLRSLPAHPFLVPLLDAGEWRGVPYLIFPDEAEAEPLCLSRVSPLPLRQIVALVCSVARGLEHAHGYGLIHGNVTMASLLQSRAPGTPVLIAGMGIRALLEAQGLEPVEMPYAHLRTVWGTYLGDPLSLAPECLLGRVPDQRSDIYALGMVFYQLLVGVSCLPAANEKNNYLHLAAGALYRPRPLPSGLPDQITALLRGMITLHPHERFGSMREVVAACTAFLSEGGSALALSA